jgi:hypothetical protein
MSDGNVTLLITPIERDNMLTVNKIEATLESNCTCTYLDDDGNEVESWNDCHGCWEDSVEWFNEDLLYPWMAANNYHDNTPIKIVSPNLGWMRQAAYKDTYVKDLVQDLTINGDFTLRFTLEGDTLTCVRSSHDEYGASFTFELREEDEY